MELLLCFDLVCVVAPAGGCLVAVYRCGAHVDGGQAGDERLWYEKGYPYIKYEMPFYFLGHLFEIFSKSTYI